MNVEGNNREALQLNPQHISSYALTIEEKTVFGDWATRGKIKAVDEDAAAQQLQILVDNLEKYGYEQYEVSNFSKLAFNQNTTATIGKTKTILGVGPSAHSYNGSSRQYNISNNHHLCEFNPIREDSCIDLKFLPGKIKLTNTCLRP